MSPFIARFSVTLVIRVAKANRYSTKWLSKAYIEMAVPLVTRNGNKTISLSLAVRLLGNPPIGSYPPAELGSLVTFGLLGLMQPLRSWLGQYMKFAHTPLMSSLMPLGCMWTGDTWGYACLNIVMLRRRVSSSSEEYDHVQGFFLKSEFLLHGQPPIRAQVVSRSGSRKNQYEPSF